MPPTEGFTDLASSALADIGTEPGEAGEAAAEPTETPAETPEPQGEAAELPADDGDGLAEDDGEGEDGDESTGGKGWTIKLPANDNGEEESVTVSRAEASRMLKILGLPAATLPEGVKSAVMARTDYTKKTQEIAVERRELAQETARVNKQQQSMQGWVGNLKRGDVPQRAHELKRVFGQQWYDDMVTHSINEEVKRLELSPEEVARQEIAAEREELARDKQGHAQRMQQEQSQKNASYWQGKFEQWGPPAFEAAGLPPTQANYDRVQKKLVPLFDANYPINQETLGAAVQEAAADWKEEQSGHLSQLDVDNLVATLGEAKVKELLAHQGAKQAAKLKGRNAAPSGNSGRSAGPRPKLPATNGMGDFFDELAGGRWEP
jgi:hypothetical protein